MSKRSSYVRTAVAILKDNQNVKRRSVASFINGRLVTGTRSLHRTPASRRWRLFWRIKAVGR